MSKNNWVGYGGLAHNEDVRKKLIDAISKKHSIYSVIYNSNHRFWVEVIFNNENDIPLENSEKYADIKEIINYILKDEHNSSISSFKSSSRENLDSTIAQNIYFNDVMIPAIRKLEENLPKLKKELKEKYPNIYEITNGNQSIVVIFLNEVDFMERKRRNPEDKHLTGFIKKGLRENILKNCLIVLDEAPDSKMYNVKFSHKNLLGDNTPQNLEWLAFSDWEYGSRLY